MRESNTGSQAVTASRRWMRTLTVRQKLAIMAAALIIPTLGLLGWNVYVKYQSIDFTASELAGLAYYEPLAEIGRRLDEIDSLGDQDDAARRAAALAEVERQVARMDALDARYGTESSRKQWADIRAAYGSLKSSTFKSGEERFAAFQGLADRMDALRGRIATDWKLVLDPEAGGYFAIDVAVNRIPDLERQMDVLTQHLAVLATHAEASAAERLNVLKDATIAADRVAAIRSAYSEARKGTAEDAKVKALFDASSMQWEVQLTGWLTQLSTELMKPAADRKALAQLVADAAPLPAQVGKAHGEIDAIAAAVLEHRRSHDVWQMGISTSATVLSIGFGIWLMYSLAWRLAGAVTRLEVITHRITDGHFDNVLDSTGTDEISLLFARVNTMQRKLASEEAARAADAISIARLRGALDCAQANLMVADEQHHLVYLNRAVDRLFRDAEPRIREQIPGFAAGGLIGSNIDVFHADKERQRQVLAGLTASHTLEMSLGGHQFRVTLNPIVDDRGTRLGTVVEWLDRTEEVAAERDVAALVDAVLEGRLDARVDVTDKKGFFLTLSKGLNEVVDNVGAVTAEVRKLVAAANRGDLSGRIQLEGRAGLYRTLGEGVNTLVADVGEVVAEVQTLVASANRGDLTQRMPSRGADSLLTRVAASINELMENMSTLVRDVKLAAAEVSRGADELSQGNTHLSQRTEQAATSLEQTASSMEQMTSTVRHNADNAGQANQLAIAARDQADKGGAVVGRAIEAMNAINEASRRIVDIIGVIDDIAFQTNLLALNAAVEAARAGEQGRGFAVVASEVRNLAGRSATAAKEIKALIQTSVERVDQGAQLVGDSGATLEQIVQAIKRLSDIVAEIAAASHEQSSGIEQVNRAVTQLDELTQQNAALVEESSAASEAMAEQARKLDAAMARYVVARRAVTAADASAWRKASNG